MKKIIVGASILALSLASFNFVNANHHLETMSSDSHTMMDMQGEYGMFTDFVRDDLSEAEKVELKALLEQQKAGMAMTMDIVKKVKAGELNNFEEFEKIAPKRKAMIAKLKVFMKDQKAFENMCANHGNELIATLFADEKMVAKYKAQYEKTLKNKLTMVYMKKGDTLKKSLHMLYHKNIEAKNIKNISAIRALELIVEDIKKGTVSEEFGDFTQFAKKDLTETQKQELNQILSDRKMAQEKIKKMLTEAKMNGTFDETFKKVEEMRINCKSRFSPYLDESKIEAFNTHCKILGEKLKASFMN